MDNSIFTFASFFGVIIGITSSSLIDSYINHDNFLSENNVPRESRILQDKKNSENSVEYAI